MKENRIVGTLFLMPRDKSTNMYIYGATDINGKQQEEIKNDAHD